MSNLNYLLDKQHDLNLILSRLTEKFEPVREKLESDYRKNQELITETRNLMRLDVLNLLRSSEAVNEANYDTIINRRNMILEKVHNELPKKWDNSEIFSIFASAERYLNAGDYVNAKLNYDKFLTETFYFLSTDSNFEPKVITKNMIIETVQTLLEKRFSVEQEPITKPVTKPTTTPTKPTQDPNKIPIIKPSVLPEPKAINEVIYTDAVVEYVGDLKDESPFTINGQRWEYCLGRYPDGKVTTAVYNFDQDIAYSYDWFQTEVLNGLNEGDEALINVIDNGVASRLSNSENKNVKNFQTKSNKIK